jgi:hypothetical protein
MGIPNRSVLIAASISLSTVAFILRLPSPPVRDRDAGSLFGYRFTDKDTQ